VHTAASGEAAPSAVILSPFTAELPGTDPGSIPLRLDSCFAGDAAGQVEVVRDSAVTLDKLASVMDSGLGVFYRAEHGALVPSDTTTSEAKQCALSRARVTACSSRRAPP
jgi:hypothetical protein